MKRFKSVVRSFAVSVPQSLQRWLAIVLFVLGLSAVPSFSQETRVLAPHRPAPPLLEHPVKWHDPAVLRSMVGGLWITDGNFKSRIFLKSSVETDPIDATPIVYLSNGRKYTLPRVHLEPAGVAVISINEALAEQGIASWATLTGYIEIQYNWPWNALCVTVEDADVAHSTIFSYGLRNSTVAAAQGLPQAGASAEHAVEGLWWRQEGNVTGFVAVSNTSSEPLRVRVQTGDDQNRPLAEHVVTVSPNGTKLVTLGELQQTANRAGGVRVTYRGAEDALIVNGGLEDQSVGYSAAIPFSPAQTASNGTSSVRYAELGLMSGIADQMMSFPVGTVFTPYSVLRNVSSGPVTVTPTLWWMQGASSHSKRLNSLSLPSGRTEVLDMRALLEGAGLKNFNGNLNLTMDVEGRPQALLMAAGSVDQKNTYVFEVRPNRIEESQGRALSYWDTANGDDTMVTVWNPADEEQQFVFKLSFTGGHYNFPIHLGPKASYTFNISEVIDNQIPDSEGNIIPPSIHAGSADLGGTEGENQDILVAFDAGTYNVVKATCIMRCTTCHGATNFWVQTVPFSVTISSAKQLNSIVQYDSGSQSDLTSTSSWSSSATNIATVSVGLVTGHANGGVNVVATSPTETQAGTDCQPYTPPPCPRTPMQSSGPGTVVSASLSQRTSGTVSADDAALGAYQTAEGTTSLGAIIGTGTPVQGCFVGNEMVGAIVPSTYTGNVILHRWIQADAYYKDQAPYPGGVTNQDDTSAPGLRDDNPQSGSSAGKIYDLDAPGISINQADGIVYRYRGNFYAYAALPDGTRVSPYYNYYVRVSCKRTTSGYQFDSTLAGDNQIQAGTTLTTWNFQ